MCKLLQDVLHCLKNTEKYCFLYNKKVRKQYVFCLLVFIIKMLEIYIINQKTMEGDGSIYFI